MRCTSHTGIERSQAIRAIEVYSEDDSTGSMVRAFVGGSIRRIDGCEVSFTPAGNTTAQTSAPLSSSASRGGCEKLPIIPMKMTRGPSLARTVFDIGHSII